MAIPLDRPAISSAARAVARSVAEAVLPASIIVWRGRSDSNRVALTFDDGPSELSRDYVEVLDRLGARATFFVVGEQCRAMPGLASEIALRGHQLGWHGWSHRRFPELEAAGLLERELRCAEGSLSTSTTARTLVRPPHGATSLRALATCARAGFTTVLWSCDSGDWCTRSVNGVIAAVTQARLLRGAIVLLHEGQAWTLEALPAIVANLTEKGHELVTVGQLLGA